CRNAPRRASLQAFPAAGHDVSCSNMGDSSPVPDSQVGGSPVFTTTEWSVVLHAADGASAQADQALERLCRTYWYPLYAYVRRRGYNPHEAQDLTQAFFERMLEKSFLRAVDRSKGTFRSFLIAALEHFLAKDWRRAHAQKRGGHAKFLSLDDESPEQQYLEVSASTLTPEQVYDQQWGITLLEQVLQKLSNEFDAAGKAAAFAEMKIFLTG